MTIRLKSNLVGVFVLCAFMTTLVSANVRDGSIVGDDGRGMHEGEMVVYHYFSPEDEQVLRERIEELQNEIARVEDSIDAFFSEAAALEKQYQNARNQVVAKKNQYER